MFIFSCTKERKEEVPFSMAIGNGELMFNQTLTHGNSKNEIIIIYHDFLPTPRRGSHVKSDKTHTQSSRYTP